MKEVPNGASSDREGPCRGDSQKQGWEIREIVVSPRKASIQGGGSEQECGYWTHHMTPRPLVTLRGTVSVVVGTKSLLEWIQKRMGREELEADHMGNSFEKFCYKRAKNNSTVSHKESGNRKTFYLLGKTIKSLYANEWSWFTWKYCIHRVFFFFT